MNAAAAAPEIVEEAKQELAPFSEFESKLAKLKADNNVVFDYADPKGNKEARSHIHGIRLIKGNLERTRKEKKADALARGRLIDSEATRIEGELDALIKVHETPLIEIEQKEAARLRAIKEKIDSLAAYRLAAPDTNSETLQAHLLHIEEFVIDESFGDSVTAATTAREVARADLTKRLASRLQYESEQVELDKLRQESAERAKKDRDEQIARDAAVEATRKAEQAVQAERDAAAERERRLQAESVRQAAALEAANKATIEARERAAKAEAEAKAKAERDLLQKQADEKAAEEKREADKKHCAAINREAAAGFVALGLSEEMARMVVTSIAKKLIKNISIQY